MRIFMSPWNLETLGPKSPNEVWVVSLTKLGTKRFRLLVCQYPTLFIMKDKPRSRY